MEKYTFIAEYKGGTYISQYYAEDVYHGLLLWGKGLPPKHFSLAKRKKILDSIINDWDISKPILLDGIENVWSTFFSGNKDHYVLLNIVLTI
jgi:hypothetical protein